ncbi:SSI family serine proteinase inhibitor [Streptomyces sp. NRRL S-87]|uniref:SSI family serine proteinase inhibitor n=1 Tax=Streptomyces sp. NRRL S-87 TaxID=1463920 RepID=UPI0004BEB974|nr:SSI family serine proteinase inhibitor [Streptomyces sp. NRRL S-87]
MLRRIALAAVSSALVAAPLAAPALAAPALAAAPGLAAGPLPPLPSLGLLDPEPAPVDGPDRLTVTVAETGSSYQGSYTLECHPAGGTHPQAARACDRLDRLWADGKDPFAPVSRRQMCTMVDGGRATADVSGTWRGRQVDAHFNRKNGCEISRWEDLEPVLPSAAPRSRA